MSRAGTLVAALALALPGCGGSSGSSSDGGGAGSSGGGASTLGATGCTNIQDSCMSNAGTMTPSCEEHGGFDPGSVANFMKSCQRPNQTYSTGPCDRTGAIGGCAVAINGTCSVAWGYGTLVTVDDLKTSCAGIAHSTFITP
ncbi:MAG TPA: hypothetical protein VHL80_11255 [Polyangia bacterium]|nr:hypothetical protein [Polyangia bacterium]